MTLNPSIQKQKIMMLIALLSFAFPIDLNAQTVWNKTYIEDRPVLLFSSVLKDSNSYFVTGVTSDFTNLSRSFIGKIDENGTFTNHRSIYDSVVKNYGTFYNTLIKTLTGEFAQTGYSGDSLARLFFSTFDKDLDTVTIHEYYTPGIIAYYGYDILQYDSSSYYITGVTSDSISLDANVVLVKIDSYGNRVWERYYNKYIQDYAKSIIKLNNGNLLMGCVRLDLGQPNEHANTWLLEVDTDGTIKRQWFDPNDSTYAAEGLKQTSDSGFIYGAQKKHSQSFSDIYYTATIVKVSNSFQKQWTFKDGDKSLYTGINDIEELADGSFVACGNKPFYAPNFNTLSGWVVKLSSTGQVIWNNVYRGIDSTGTLNFLTDIDVLPDGSLIAVGQCQHSGHIPSQVGWFLKLDSNGCEIENCTVGVEKIENTIRQIIVYPNPASDKVNVSFNADEEVNEIVVCDVTGRELQKQKMQQQNTPLEIDIKDLPHGLYFLQVKDEKGVVATAKVAVSR